MRPFISLRIRSRTAFLSSRDNPANSLSRTADERLRLRITEPRLGYRCTGPFPVQVGHVYDIDIDRKVQQIQILLDLRRMHRLDIDRLFFFLPDLQQGDQTFRNVRQIHSVQDVCRVFPVAAQIARRDRQIAGPEFLRKRLHRKSVVDVLYDPVDRSCQFVLFVQILQSPEMPFVLVAAQRMLDIAGNRTVHVLSRTAARGKRRCPVVV